MQVLVIGNNKYKKGLARLTNDQVIRIRAEYNKRPFCVGKRAYELGISTKGLGSILRGDTYKNLPGAVTKLCLLNASNVDELRREYREKPFVIEYRAKELKMGAGTLRKYLKEEIEGTTEPPVSKRFRYHYPERKELIAKIREEYAQKRFKLRVKSAETGISISTLSKALNNKAYKNV